MNRRVSAGLLIFGAALALRVIWLVSSAAKQSATLDLPDEQLHWQLARNVAILGELVSEDGLRAARMPVYPLFLALFARWEGAGIIAARVAQALIGAATAWLVYSLARRTMDRRAGILAGTLVAIDLYAVFFANLLLTETLFTFIGTALVYCVAIVSGLARRVTAADGPGSTPDTHVSGSAILGVGLFGALAVLTRPSSLGWVVLLWVGACIVDRTRERAIWRVAAWAALLGAALLPWGLRNRTAIGDFAWLSTNGGVTLYDGQGPQATGASDQSFRDEIPELHRLNEVDQDRFLRDAAIREMRANPWRVVELARIKFLRTWSLVPNAEAYRTGWRDLASATFTGGVLIAAAIGTWRLRRRPALLALLWLPILYFTLLHCIYIGSLRYRVPVMPFVEILAAAAIVSRASAGDSSRVTNPAT